MTWITRSLGNPKRKVWCSKAAVSLDYKTKIIESSRIWRRLSKVSTAPFMTIDVDLHTITNTLLCANNSVNCHAVICWPFMYIFWRDTARELWNRSYFPTLFTTVLLAFRSHLLSGHISFSSYFTLAHLILCVQQAGEIDNLSVSLGQSSLFVIVCRSTSIVINGAVDTLLSLLQVLLDS